MQEIIPGVWHWATFHDGIKANVNSYYVEPAGVVIDPMVPEEGMEVLADRTRPQQVVLTSGLHTRHADRFADEFGCVIVVSREAADRIGGALEAETYHENQYIAPGINPVRIGVLAPDEYALHIEVADGAMAFADGLTHYGGALGFFPDELLGDDPEGVKENLKRRFRELLERDFENLLFAHGEPIVGNGKAVLRDFANSPVGHEESGSIQ